MEHINVGSRIEAHLCLLKDLLVLSHEEKV